jgi:uncharacterized low-complexity protein
MRKQEKTTISPAARLTGTLLATSLLGLLPGMGAQAFGFTSLGTGAAVRSELLGTTVNAFSFDGKCGGDKAAADKMHDAKADGSKMAEAKGKDGKCGEGKCGAGKDKAKAEAGTTTGKMTAGSANGGKMAEAKGKDGKCGEGKCGGSKK